MNNCFFTHRFIMYIVACFVIVFAVSCASQPKLMVKNVEQATGLEKNTVFYALPQTVITVRVDVIRITRKAGIFHNYAKTHFGYVDVPHKDDVQWKISSITLDSYAIPDNKHYYMVENEKKEWPIYINTNNEGLLYTINEATPSETIPQSNVAHNMQDNMLPMSDFAHARIRGNFAVKTDTVYKTIMRDSSFVRVPVIEKQVKAKSLDEQAQEAADFIFKLRKRRFKHLAGDYDKLFDGQALQVMVNELAKIEEDYLSQFVGKTFTDQISYTFDFIPDEKNILSPNVICYFSPTSGISATEQNGWLPITIDVIKTGYNLPMQNFAVKQQQNTDKLRGLYYKVPAEAMVHIDMDNKLRTTQKILLPQLGATMLLPFAVIKGNKVLFYPYLGSIDKIVPLQTKK